MLFRRSKGFTLWSVYRMSGLSQGGVGRFLHEQDARDHARELGEHDGLRYEVREEGAY